MSHPLPIPGVGTLSPALAAIVEQQLADCDSVTQRALAAMREAIPEYRQLDDPAIREDVRDSVRHNVQMWYEALRTGLPPSAAALQTIAAFGRHRAHQGVSLTSLMQAFRTGSRVLWEVLLERAGDNPDIHRELLFKVSPYILVHFDLLGQTVGQAHSSELHQRARWRDRLRHELCGVIFSHPDDHEAFRDRALALGLDAGSPHLALALRTARDSPTDVLSQDAGQENLIAITARVLGMERDGFLRTLRNGQLLLWVPLPTGEPTPEGERRLTGLAETLVKSSSLLGAVGLGLPDAGPRGWKRSAEQALTALELGTRIAPGQRVHRYLDVALDDALMHGDNVVRYFEAMMERLAVEPHLLKTLQAFFDHRQHRKAVAGALHIHPNTLSYRLDRIETILGARMDDPQWQSRLHSALRLRQMSAAPERSVGGG